MAQEFDFSEDVELWDAIETVEYFVYNATLDSYPESFDIQGLFRAGSSGVTGLLGGSVPSSFSRLHLEAKDCLERLIYPKVNDKIKTQDDVTWYVDAVDSETRDTRYALTLSKGRS